MMKKAVMIAVIESIMNTTARNIRAGKLDIYNDQGIIPRIPVGQT